MTNFMRPADVTVIFAKISNLYNVSISGDECGLLDYTDFLCEYRKFTIYFKTKEDIEKLGLLFEFEENVFICEDIEFTNENRNIVNLSLVYFCIPDTKFKKDFIKVFKNINIEKLLSDTKIVKSNYSVSDLSSLKFINLKNWHVTMDSNILKLTLVLNKKRYSDYFFDILKLSVESIVLLIEGYSIGYESINSLIYDCDKLREVSYNYIICKV